MKLRIRLQLEVCGCVSANLATVLFGVWVSRVKGDISSVLRDRNEITLKSWLKKVQPTQNAIKAAIKCSRK